MDPPAAVGRYEVRRELGHGTMGVVYEAFDPDLGRPIALKVIQGALGASDDERRVFEQRFFAEARAAARLAHPGIVVVHDVGRDTGSGALFMALELLRGRPLDGVLRERTRLEWREALRIALRVARALHHAHVNAIVHRDIKPANIMLLESGEAKIMDFGIAKVEAAHLTATGQFLGTPLYMSPEQTLAQPVDARSDIFSLGAVLYEMLTGRQAFGGATVTKILFQIVSREPDPPTLLVPELPEGIDYVVARCLAKDVGLRYQDAQALAEDLEDILAGRAARGQAAWSAPKASGTMVASRPGAAAFTPSTDADASGSSVPETPPRAGPSPELRIAAPDVASRPRSRSPVPAPTAARPFATKGVVIGTALAGIGVLSLALVGVFLWIRPGPVARRVPVPNAEAARATSGASSERSDTSTDDRAADTQPAQEATSGPAHLLIDFEHSLKGGVLRVWVDDDRVIEQEFGGRVTREIAGIKLRKGHLSEALEIKPGRRLVRVQVEWEGDSKTETTRFNFKPGATYQLKARLGSLGGLRKDLSLEWY
jgi:serine/threonine protein kinase